MLNDLKNEKSKKIKMIWWEILLIILSILGWTIVFVTFLIFIIKDVKNDYSILKKLNDIAKDLEKNKNNIGVKNNEK